MTAASYTEDLTDLSTAESNTNWVELTGTITLTLGSEAFNAQGTPAGADGDYPFIQGNYSVTQDCTKNTAVGSLAYNNGAGTGGHGTDGAYFVWQNFMVASNIETYANDGFMLCVGSGQSAYDVWVVGGRDKSPYPYGGWINHVVNTTVTPDYTAGSPTATEQYIGAAVYVSTGPSKGETHNVDVIRYGRGSAIFQFGELALGYATISGFAAQNDNTNNRWGLIQEAAGGYLWKGRMQLGTVTNAVDFRDSNVNIFIQWTPKVTANFNLIECINASSNIEMTNFNFTCLDTTTASQGRFLMTDQCDVVLDGCSFIDMDTFVFDKGATKTVNVLDCVFRRCNTITHGGADMTGSQVLLSTVNADTGAVVYDEAADPDGVLDDMIFSKGTNSHHAIDFGTNVDSSLTSITLRGIAFNGFGATDDANDSTVRFLATTGTLTLNLIDCTVDGVSPVASGGGKNFSVDDAAGMTVTVVVQPVTLSVTVKDKETLATIDGVQTSIHTNDASFTELMNEDTVSGVASESYAGSTPQEIVWRCRKSDDLDNPRYKAQSGIDTITSDGFSLTVLLERNTVLN